MNWSVGLLRKSLQLFIARISAYVLDVFSQPREVPCVLKVRSEAAERLIREASSISELNNDR